jgi:Animal haem peroxidase
MISPRQLEPDELLKLAGTRVPPSTSYTRMFPGLPAQGATNPRLEQGLTELGSKMIAAPTDRPDPQDPPPMQGYTYFGQFIDHDLTLDLTPLGAATRKVEHTRNFRTPFLDLDQLYGGGPNLSPFLYRSDCRPGEERLLIGETRPQNINGQEFPLSRNDLPRNSEGIALTGDPRQDENLIIAQLHVAFLKLHNRIMDCLEGGKIQNVGPKRATLFEQARRLVTWHHQWVVRHDYLRQILDQDVFGELPQDGKLRRTSLRAEFQIPVEFSAAAFRFGHSMVRNEYLINQKHLDASLKDDLLQLTGTPGTARRAAPSLPADWVIDWKFFFLIEFEPDEVRHSSAIHPALAAGLHHLGEQTKLFNVPMVGAIQSSTDRKIEMRHEPRLPVITLLRGARIGLPSGQSVAKRIVRQRPGARIIGDEEIAHGPHEETLRKYRFHKDTPLWYYVLKEAEVLQKGARLGSVGSRIVADVITRALATDADSYIRVDPNWTPSLPARDSDPKMFGMADLLRFATGSTCA